ncbi:MAG: cyclase family protein [Proteobacteria bacterium]|nr:cyclase family protein [Pseudomonadota bacterium]
MIIDLSHTIEDGMPVFPGSTSPEVIDLELYAEHGVYVQQYKIDGHVGTHIDVPAHLINDGGSTASMEISDFHGTARVLDCRDYEAGPSIDKEILDQLKEPELPDFLIFYTGWSKLWGQRKYYRNFPVISQGLAQFLSQSKIKGLGLDTISIDSMQDSHLPNHKTILGSDKIIIENLTNLQELIGRKFLLSCFPLKFFNGDGSPVRAVAMDEG